MIYDWYELFNLSEVNSRVSFEKTMILEGLGQKTILVVNGETTSIIYDDIMLSINLNDRIPFEFEGHVVFLDSNNNIWLGIAQ
jgi:hypothetical protein